MIVILMGAAGSGKTTVGSALAGALGWAFYDADDLHPPANVAKMRLGVPLTAEDRAPWLARIQALVASLAGRGESGVVACSALREEYRRTIAEGVRGVLWVFLAADARLLHGRLQRRPGHFAGPAILPSQLAELEVPREAIALEADRPVEDLVWEIRARLPGA